MVDVNVVIAGVLLVGAFLLAIKVLKTMFEAAVVAGISAIFYVVMAVSFDYPLKTETVLGFAAFGTVLYVGYSVLLPILGLGWDIVTLPVDFLRFASKRYRKLKKSRRLSKIEKTLKKHDEKLDDDEDGSKTKEVVLDKVAGKDTSQD